MSAYYLIKVSVSSFQKADSGLIQNILIAFMTQSGLLEAGSHTSGQEIPRL